MQSVFFWNRCNNDFRFLWIWRQKETFYQSQTFSWYSWSRSNKYMSAYSR